MTALRIDGVSVTFGATRVVSEVSAAVGAGEWVVLVGPNGAGKTSLLRAVAGLVPYTGTVVFDGDGERPLPRREIARRVALVPQEPLLPVEMTVAEYVLLGRTPYLGYLGREGRRDREAAGRALARLDLVELARRPLGSLSGGERQRAVLARALAQEAAVLLLDEPTASLDVGREQQVLELVDELRREHALAVLAAMHDLTLAGQYADRLLFLAAGRVVAAGSARHVLTEERVSLHYGASVKVLADEEFGLVVVPRRAAG